MNAPKTWLTTDTHFNHRKMLEAGWRPADYQERIISNWKRMVAPQDTVFHLGDVILGRNAELALIMQELPGTKILILGNHDGEQPSWYMARGFTFVAKGILHNGAWLTHAPQAVLPDGALINVHGHLHGDAHRGDVADLPVQCKLLALEDTDYCPVEFNEFTGITALRQALMGCAV